MEGNLGLRSDGTTLDRGGDRAAQELRTMESNGPWIDLSSDGRGPTPKDVNMTREKRINGRRPAPPCPPFLSGPGQVRVDEHVALLRDPAQFEFLIRKEDFFEEGIATIFGIANDQAELAFFCFHCGRFSPEKAQRWLQERKLDHLHFCEAPFTSSSNGML